MNRLVNNSTSSDTKRLKCAVAETWRWGGDFKSAPRMLQFVSHALSWRDSITVGLEAPVFDN